MLTLLAVLWIAGGASRPDALGQVVVRFASFFALAVSVAFSGLPRVGTARPVCWLLLAMLAATVVQLIPLPPSIWLSLPGREPLAQAATLIGEPQPWRPIAIVPGAAANAAMSLIVPLALLVLTLHLTTWERAKLQNIVLLLIVASMLFGLLQFSGIRFDNPLVNDTIGEVSGPFANRNHLALFLAIGCLITPAWAFPAVQRQPGWRAPCALGVILLLELTILATGSRAGLVLGGLGLALGLAVARQGLSRAVRRYPRWIVHTAVWGAFAVITLLVLISFAADRAVSINRLLTMDAGQDMRSRALPTVMAMIKIYFPVGSGFGGFDPIFRMHEPFNLLKLSYFNHAHNDYLEVILDAGALGALLISVLLLWFVWRSYGVWKQPNDDASLRGRMGSAILLLVALASLFDYPARTPMMMAVVVIAALWLCGERTPGRAHTLPVADQHL
jgi:O-antigen ligase